MAEAEASENPPDDVLPPYVLGVRAQVQRSTARLRSRMFAGHSELSTRIQAESVRVVTQYSVRGVPAPAALARFGSMVGAWRSAASVCRSRAQLLADEANQLLACYWDTAWTRARRAHALEEHRPAGWLPGKVALDGTWHHLDDGLLSDRWYAPGLPERGSDPSAVAQALYILDHQPARDGSTAESAYRG
ncbi:hypothetical protein ABZ876_16470 [Streptomyces sp. NPDC046931]|uniref:hypothetical protein n=1 Tax=Streptomyces sp. NPDC046931 TaxID=3154806 RepID=UPI003409EBAE